MPDAASSSRNTSISPHYVITLEVPGRNSGLICRTTLVPVARDGGRYLVVLRRVRVGPSGSATCGPPTGKSCSAAGTGTRPG